ncbi:MAG TPA: sugar ABC transporter ATP-binding protein [Conexibacter sp.]|nr:sugar ABC transporter ATP-binding protein [Conexibacter sp.]
MSQHDEREVLARAEGLRKAYPGLVAVDDVDFEIRAGEVVGLLGKNGAGKSTLIKLMVGVQRADAGRLELLGQEVDLNHHGAANARALGLAVMFQELEIFPGMSVAENVGLASRPPRRLGLVDYRRLHRTVREVLDTVDPEIDSEATIDTLSPAQQRAVMIARAVYQGARLLVLDEPTTSLTAREIDALHALVRRLAERGNAVVYVSHRLEEIMQVTDRVVVMRDGEVVGEMGTGRTTIRGLIATITGNEDGTTAAERRVEKGVGTRPLGPVRLRVSELRRREVLHDVSFDVHAGEILGIGGLVGSGRTELLRALFGADPADGGTIAVDGRELRISSPRDAIDAGIVLLPEDRRHQGLVDTFGIRENVTLATLPAFRAGRLPMPSKRSERSATVELMEGLSMRARGPEQLVAHLSGGTQQKVVIAKWMLRQGQLLMFDEPTQGIDVDAKAEVYALMERFAEGGASVVLVSSEFSELVAVCDRVVVLREGTVVRTLAGAEVTEAAITDACYAGTAPA